MMQPSLLSTMLDQQYQTSAISVSCCIYIRILQHNIHSIQGTHDVQDITYNIQGEPVTVTIVYIENTEALRALLALMYLDQDSNIGCNQSIYAAIRRSEDNFPLPMGDPAMTNSYMGLAYDIERNGLEDKAYPAVRRDVQDNIGKYSYRQDELIGW